MSKKYKLTTIKDIFESVPVNKIQLCLKELGEMMVQAKDMDKAMCLASELVSGVKPILAFDFPEEITWIDDDKGIIENRYMMPGNNELLIKTTTVVDDNIHK